MSQQTFDPAATERHGTTAPQGTDPELADKAVNDLRQGKSERRSSATSEVMQQLGGSLGIQ
jgi:hypothetical protein